MLRAKVKTAKTQSTPCDSSKRAVLYIQHELKLHTFAPEDATKTSQQQHLQLQLKRCKMELIAHHWSIFQTVGIFMAYHWTIFPLILFFFFPTSHLPCYPLPIPLCTPLSSPGRDTKGPVRQSNQELPWMAGAHISPSIPRYLSRQNSSRRYDWEGSTEKLEAKPLALEIKYNAVGKCNGWHRVVASLTFRSFKGSRCKMCFKKKVGIICLFSSIPLQPKSHVALKLTSAVDSHVSQKAHIRRCVQEIQKLSVCR